MTLPDLHRQIGFIRRVTTRLGLKLELSDRLADLHLHPQQQSAVAASASLRRRLSYYYTRLHALESRIPTPELLSEQAYNRMITLGYEIDAADSVRLSTLRHAHAHRLHA